jgi:hypothetical protein
MSDPKTDEEIQTERALFAARSARSDELTAQAQKLLSESDKLLREAYVVRSGGRDDDLS